MTPYDWCSLACPDWSLIIKKCRLESPHVQVDSIIDSVTAIINDL